MDELALISENVLPVVTMILFSEGDFRGRAYVKKLAEEAGLHVRQDAIGNIFARWPAESHLPAVPPVRTLMPFPTREV